MSLIVIINWSKGKDKDVEEMQWCREGEGRGQKNLLRGGDPSVLKALESRGSRELCLCVRMGVPSRRKSHS